MINSVKDYTNLHKAIAQKRQKRRLLSLVLASCLLLLLIVLLLLAHTYAKRNSKYKELPIKESYNFAIDQTKITEDSRTIAMRNIEQAVQAAKLNAKAKGLIFNSRNLLLLDLQNDSVLFSQAALEQAYPASLVKIMTAILAVEHIKDLEQELVMSEEMYHEFYQIDASMAGYLAGEKTSPRELLYGLFLASGAECSTQLALAVTPNLADFVNMMNAKAEEIGMYQTNFTNVTGLHDLKQITTAYDMAKCLAYAAKYPILREIMLAKSHRAPVTKEHPKGFEYNNLVFKRFELLPNRWQFQWEILGGKTGYTDEAKQTMATLLRYQEHDYVLVTLNASVRKGLKANPLALDVANCMENLLIPHLEQPNL